MRKPKKIIQWRFAFLLIVLIMMNCRFIGIESASLSPSEATQFATSQQEISDILLSFQVATSSQSSFFALILNIWSSIFGKTESALRSLPALFSVLALFPFFGIARILFKKRIAYGATALFSLSPLLSSVGQEVSPTTLFLLFSLISTWSLLMSIRRNGLLYRLIYFGAICGALFTNPAAWFLFTFHSIFFLGSYFHHDSGEFGFRQWLTISVLIGLICSITFPTTFPPIQSPFANGIPTPFWGFGKLLFHFSGSLLLLIPFTTALIAVLFFSKNYFTKFHFMHGRTIFVSIWFFATAIPPFLFGYAKGDLGSVDGATAALFPFLLLSSTGIDTLIRNKHRHTLFISIFLLSGITIKLNTDHNKIPWDNLVNNKNKYSGIIAIGSDLINSFAYYGKETTKTSSLIIEDLALTAPSTQSKIDQFCNVHATLTFMSNTPEKTVLIQNYLSSRYTLQSRTLYSSPRWRTSNEPALLVLTFSRKITKNH